MAKIRQRSATQAFSQKLLWSQKPKVDTHNEDAINTKNRQPKSQV